MFSLYLLSVDCFLMFGPAFLLYTVSAIAIVLVLIFYCEPRFGQTNIMVYIGVCSIIGSLTVSIPWFFSKHKEFLGKYLFILTIFAVDIIIPSFSFSNYGHMLFVHFNKIFYT